MVVRGHIVMPILVTVLAASDVGVVHVAPLHLLDPETPGAEAGEMGALHNEKGRKLSKKATITRRSSAEIQRLRGTLELRCRYGCGSHVVITTTTNGKTIVLSETRGGAFVIDENDQAVWVGGDGDYDFHSCGDFEEVL